MTRARQTFSILLLASSIYLSLYIGLVPLNTTIQNDIVPILPFWALVSFGAFLLFRLGWGVLNFKDVPEAYFDLMKEVDQARSELRMSGIDLN